MKKKERKSTSIYKLRTEKVDRTTDTKIKSGKLLCDTSKQIHDTLHDFPEKHIL